MVVLAVEEYERLRHLEQAQAPLFADLMLDMGRRLSYATCGVGSQVPRLSGDGCLAFRLNLTLMTI